MGKHEKKNIIGSWHTAALVLSMCISAWFAIRWLVFDVQTARALQSALPVWSIAFPLGVWVLGWMILGLGPFVSPPTRHHRIFQAVSFFWFLGCVTGLGIVLYGLTRGPDSIRIGGTLVAIGLVLCACALVMLLIALRSGKGAAFFMHALSSALFAAAFCLSAGMQQGFVFLFPGFALGSAVFLFYLFGGLELHSARPGFFRLSQLLNILSDNRKSLTRKAWWRFHGVVLLLCAVFFSGVLLNNTFTILPDTIEDTHTVMLDIPPGEAWTWITEPSHLLMWHTDFTEYIIPDISEGHVGTVYYLTGEENGERFTMECVITNWVKPHEFSFQGSLPGYDIHGTYVIEPAEDGSVVIFTEAYAFRNLRERIMAVLSGRKPALQSIEQRLKNLQEVTGKR